MPKPFFRILLLAAAGLLMLPAASWAQTFTFDTGTQGWRVYNISYLGEPLVNPQPVESPAFDGVIGLPPGSLRVIDLASETWIGITGSAIAGDKSSAYGLASVSYDILYRTRDEAIYAAVGLLGGGRTVYLATPQPPLNVWLHRDFPLTAGEWKLGSINGSVATEADLRALLADFRGLFIHTEWKTGPDDTSVDNVIFGAAAAPKCPLDYNRDAFLNLDDVADYINDFYTAPAIPAGLQPLAPTYPDIVVGFGVPCPLAADASAPYDPNAYRALGFRIGYSPDGSNSCPNFVGQPFPNLDNLSDFVSGYYEFVGSAGCTP